MTSEMSIGGSTRAPGGSTSSVEVSEPSPFDALEARLQALKEKMARGLPQRAEELEDAARRLAGGDAAARDDVRRHAHKLRGIAGSYGYPLLGELSAALETLARGTEPADEVVARARDLASAMHEAALPASGVVAKAPDAAPSPPVAPAVAARAPLGESANAEPVAPAVRARPAMPQVAPELEGLIVLAADDDDATRRLLEITLGQLGRMSATTFERAPLLLEELASRERVDLVVVDAMMPDMSGLELLEAVVARGLHARGTRFVVLSAATPEELGWVLPAGIEVGWLRKPFRPRELLSSLTVLVSRAGA